MVALLYTGDDDGPAMDTPSSLERAKKREELGRHRKRNTCGSVEDSEEKKAERNRRKGKKKRTWTPAEEFGKRDEERENKAGVEPERRKGEKKKRMEAFDLEDGEIEGEDGEIDGEFEGEKGAGVIDIENGLRISDPYALSNFRISEPLVKQLKAKGIESLFAIQALTFDAIMDGNDLVGRARTGQGKTLAFVLPILESLIASGAVTGQRPLYGRSPSVLLLTPTRELAKQVREDFEFFGKAVGISTVCVYGGAPYGPQEGALRRGVDVVVGTPGRVKDILGKGTLNLSTLKFRVLDEADEMLNMGFVDDVERILGLIVGCVEDISPVQTLLFSATMPEWVKKIASKFLKDSKVTVDLVGDQKMKANASVKHLLLMGLKVARTQLIPDVISCYSSGGRAIVFTETRNDASELASILSGSARALHGEIAQGQRESILAGFRSGKFNVLVATDVAARGLDITDVALIIQCEPPRDVESYIHRSGRTGRAGRTGISVMICDRKKEYMIAVIERKAGFRFERISAPQPAEIAKASATSAADSVAAVSDSVLSIFRSSADELVKNSALSPTDLLAKAIAKVSGHTDVKKRSLLSGMNDAATLILQTGKCMYTPTYALNCLRKVLSDEIVNLVKGLSLTVDGMGSVFDVPSRLLDDFLKAQDEGFAISVVEKLPELQPHPDHDSQGGRRGSGGRRGGSRFGGWGRDRNRGSSSGFSRNGSQRGGSFWGGSNNRVHHG